MRHHHDFFTCSRTVMCAIIVTPPLEANKRCAGGQALEPSVPVLRNIIGQLAPILSGQGRAGMAPTTGADLAASLQVAPCCSDCAWPLAPQVLQHLTVLSRLRLLSPVMLRETDCVVQMRGERWLGALTPPHTCTAEMRSGEAFSCSADIAISVLAGGVH